MGFSDLVVQRDFGLKVCKRGNLVAKGEHIGKWERTKGEIGRSKKHFVNSVLGNS